MPSDRVHIDRRRRLEQLWLELARRRPPAAPKLRLAAEPSVRGPRGSPPADGVRERSVTVEPPVG